MYKNKEIMENSYVTISWCGVNKQMWLAKFVKIQKENNVKKEQNCK